VRILPGGVLCWLIAWQVGGWLGSPRGLAASPPARVAASAAAVGGGRRRGGGRQAALTASLEAGAGGCPMGTEAGPRVGFRVAVPLFAPLEQPGVRWATSAGLGGFGSEELKGGRRMRRGFVGRHTPALMVPRGGFQPDAVGLLGGGSRGKPHGGGGGARIAGGEDGAEAGGRGVRDRGWVSMRGIDRVVTVRGNT